MTRIHVGNDNTPFAYDVTVRSGALAEWPQVAKLDPAPHRVLIVTQPPVAAHYLNAATTAAKAAGYETAVHHLADGESAKSADTMADLWTACGEHNIRRGDLIVGLGGGVVTDIAGFVAATWNRGIRVVHIPTTLLGQVDAAVGGKSGINTAAGKNLVGAFHQPAAVIVDPSTLATLPERIFNEGFGEVIKYALLDGPEFWQLLSSLDPADSHALVDIIARSISIKAEIVTADAREHGARAHLNLGHTYGHVLEAETGYGTWLHGEAVGIGLLVAEHISRSLGGLPDLPESDVEQMLVRFGLPTSAPSLDPAAVTSRLQRDKKADATVRWVVLDALGVARLTTVDQEHVDAAIARVSRG